MDVNLGGFIPLSTVDWPGRSVCTIFFRGCHLRCPHCQNPKLRSGLTPIGLGDLEQMINESTPYISGIVFSGGEPTLQVSKLVILSHEARSHGLKVGLHTSGIMPGAMKILLSGGHLDHVALDIKASWDKYPNSLCPDTPHRVRSSLAICIEAFLFGQLPELEIVFTAFNYNLDSLSEVVQYTPRGIPLIIQQGRPMDSSSSLSREYLLSICKKLVSYKDSGCLRLRTEEKSEEIIY